MAGSVKVAAKLGATKMPKKSKKEVLKKARNYVRAEVRDRKTGKSKPEKTGTMSAENFIMGLNLQYGDQDRRKTGDDTYARSNRNASKALKQIKKKRKGFSGKGAGKAVRGY